MEKNRIHRIFNTAHRFLTYLQNNDRPELVALWRYVKAIIIWFTGLVSLQPGF